MASTQKWLTAGLFFMLLSLLWACRPQNEVVSDVPARDISFSVDTVKFDTVINEVRTFTRRFRLRNENKNAVLLSRISLRNAAQNSPFSLTINGKRGNELRDVRLKGGDSLLILINATMPRNADTLPLLIEDFIDAEFQSGKKTAVIQAWGQDAHFLRDSVLSCNTVWRGTKPFVILGDGVMIKENCKLTIEEGVRVLFAPRSYFFVFGTLDIKGTAEKRVVFTSFRNDPPYNTAIGQWGGVLFAEVSKNNSLNFTDIRNGIVGIQSNAFFSSGNEFPVKLNGCVIENFSTCGILAINSGVKAENTMINNCLKQTFAGLGGGNYELNHCTLANFSFNFFREEPQVVLRNEFEIPPNPNNPAGLKINNHLNFVFRNGILWGNLEEEIFSAKLPAFEMNLNFDRSILKSKSTFGENNLVNQNPRFKNPILQKFELDTLSPAKDYAISSGMKTDILGKNRDSKPDAGAYERIE